MQRKQPMKIIKLICTTVAALSITACGGGQSSASAQPVPESPASAASGTAPTPPVVAVSEVINGIPVPPDPGSKADATLAGLDSQGTEIAQIALKTSQFKLNEVCEGQPLSNAERTRGEIDDLWAAVEMLNEEYDFGYKPNRERIEAKKVKVNKFAAYSVSLGMVAAVEGGA